MVKKGINFNVYDARTNEDITRSVLTQIIVEEEGKSGQNLLPVNFLRRLISFYGDNLQWMVPKYLDHSMQSLTRNQEQIRDYCQTTFGSMFPFGTTLEQMSKQNVAMFDRAMRIFSPFTAMGGPLNTSPYTSTSTSGYSTRTGTPCPSTTETSPSCSTTPWTSSSTPSSCSTPTPSCTDGYETTTPTSTSWTEPSSTTPTTDCSTPETLNTPSAGDKPTGRKLSAIPTPETSKAASKSAVTGDDIQNKIAALQRQLSDLAAEGTTTSSPAGRASR